MLDIWGIISMFLLKISKYLSRTDITVCTFICSEGENTLRFFYHFFFFSQLLGTTTVMYMSRISHFLESYPFPTLPISKGASLTVRCSLDTMVRTQVLSIITHLTLNGDLSKLRTEKW